MDVNNIAARFVARKAANAVALTTPSERATLLASIEDPETLRLTVLALAEMIDGTLAGSPRARRVFNDAVRKYDRSLNQV